jgi:hypothetical protein
LFEGNNPIELAVDHYLTKAHFLLCREKQKIARQDGLGHKSHIVIEEITATDPVAGSTSATIDIVEVEGNRVFSLTKGTNNIEVHGEISNLGFRWHQLGQPASPVQMRKETIVNSAGYLYHRCEECGIIYFTFSGAFVFSRFEPILLPLAGLGLLEAPRFYLQV